MAYVEQLHPPNNVGDLPKFFSSSPKLIRKGEPKNLPRERSFEQETLQQGALINIVAAVNEEVHVEQKGKVIDPNVSGSSNDPISNTMALISNIMAPRTRTVSIPRMSLQESFCLPEKTVQRKPVFYKHSDKEVKRDTHPRLFEVRTAFSVKPKQHSHKSQQHINLEKLAKTVPTKSLILEHSFIQESKSTIHPSEGRISPAQRERDAHSWSPVRRLGAMKRSDSRQTHIVAKCDAIDLMDSTSSTPDPTSDELDPAKAVLDDSRKLIPHTLGNKTPYYRNKSLPIVFPAKTNRLMRSNSSPQSKQHIYKNKPISKHYVNQKSESMYSRVMSMPSGFGYGSLAISNGVNQDPDIYSPMCHDSNKANTFKMPHAGIVSQRSSWRERSAGTSTATITPDSSHMYAASVFSSVDVESSEVENVSELHAAVKSAMNSYPKSEHSHTSIDNYDSVRSESARTKRSCLSSRQPERNDSAKSTAKQVHFEDRPISRSSVYSSVYGEVKGQANVYGGSSIIQTHASCGRTYSPALQPMSAQELLRFKQKIIPHNPQSGSIHQQYFSTSSGIKIKTKPNEPIVKLFANNEPEQWRGSDVSDENVVEAVEEEIAHAKPEDVRAYSQSIENTEIERSDSDYSEESESDHQTELPKSRLSNEETKQDFYKLVKAIDMQSYSGYEHKKLRKVSGAHSRGSLNKTAHFVKVKIG